MALGYKFHPVDVDLPEHWRVIEIAKRLRRAAFGLYVAASCYSRKHKPGIVPRAYVEDDDPKLVAELVRVGLWIPLDDGSGWEIHNWEKKSPGRKKSSEPPGASTARVQKHRNQKKPADETVVETDETVTVTSETASVPHAGTSLSISPSSGSSSSEDQINLSGGSSPPGWWDGAAETVRMQVGRAPANLPGRWLEYLARCERKRIAPGRTDALGWLAAVAHSDGQKPRARGAEATKQPYDPDAPWLKAAGDDE